MTRLLFVRHGETEQNVLGQICTHTDGIGLSDLGVRQARSLADRLCAVPLSAVYSSPMLRALQTAIPVADARGLPVLRCHDLRELSAGELDGRSDDEAFGLLNEALDAWCTGDDSVRIGLEGDVGVDVIQRLAGVAGEVSRLYDRQNVVLVSHGGLLQVGIPWLCSNLTPNFGHRRHIENSAIIEVEVSRDTTCISWGDDIVSTTIPSILA